MRQSSFSGKHAKENKLGHLSELVSTVFRCRGSVFGIRCSRLDSRFLVRRYFGGFFWYLSQFLGAWRPECVVIGDLEV
jgi:hypothetical protein